MGSWGAGSFDNDDAIEWTAAFVHDAEGNSIEDMLGAVIDSDDDYPDERTCNAVIAAAEAVAALYGAPGTRLPEELQRWVNHQDPPTDSEPPHRALLAIASIESNSELKDLWDEAPDRAAWYTNLHNLKLRLKHPH